MTDYSELKGPERIFLEPLCCVGSNEGRQWCEDNVWPTDSDCDATGVEYVRAEAISSLEAERDARGKMVERAISIMESEPFFTTDPEMSAFVTEARATLEKKP